jgi:SAM-dependent methyltransferase
MSEPILRRTQRAIGRLVFGSRRWAFKQTAELALGVSGARILEIGSGRRDLGEDQFTVRHLFGADNEFIQSDVDPSFGHEVVDVTSMEFEEEFDLILCLYVLEHVYDFMSAIDGIHRALRPGGRVVIVLPHLYPYHDEPTDFWRFTEYSITKMLERFSSVEMKVRGYRKLPLAIWAVATR